MKKKILVLILALTMIFTLCVFTGCGNNAEEPTVSDEEYTVEEKTASDATMFLVRKDSGIKTLDDLAGKMVGVQVDSPAFVILNEGDGTELAESFGALIVEETYAICYEELQVNAIDAIAIDKKSGDALIGDNDSCEYLSESIGS